MEVAVLGRMHSVQLLTEMPLGVAVRQFVLPIPSEMVRSLAMNIQPGRKCCEIQKRFIEKDGTECVEYTIHCKWKTSKNPDLKIPTSTWNIDNRFFDRQCKWVVDKFPDILNGSLPVNIVLNTGMRNATQDFVKFWFEIENDFDLEISKISPLPEEAFKELKKFQTNVLKYDKERKVQHEYLSAHLRPYQKRAVQWMLSRECDKFRMQSPDCIYEPEYEINTKSDVKLYYYPYSEYLAKRPKVTYKLPKYFRGGILADEMGLGKTLVVLALILNNPRGDIKEVLECTAPDPVPQLEFEEEGEGPSKKKKKVSNDEESYEPSKKKMKKRRCDDLDDIPDIRVKCICRSRSMECVVQCQGCSLFQHESCLGYDDRNMYFCSACWETKFVNSKATLIIAPQSIVRQWKDEVEKHVDDEDLKVYVYKGLRMGFVQPSVLASCDIVLTTYEVLNDDFDYTNMKRKSGLFLKQVPPILRVKWWRLCLDEAQMVEQGRTKNGYFVVGTMAKLISAVNKWNVTGTPVKSSIDELYNLISWIGVAPFDDQNFWQNSLMDLYARGYVVPLFSVLSQIFWRNSKADVENELTIPNVTTVYHPLKFTAIESSFYMREHNAVYADFRSKLEPGSVFLRVLNRKGMTLERILAPMLHLRQACSHHLAVRDNEIYNQGNKANDGINNYMTLGSLLQYLIEKTRTECSKSLKTYVDCVSRMAAMCDIIDDHEEAADYYKKGLTLIREYERRGVKVEILQNVHVVENLARILKICPTVTTPVPLEDLEKTAKDLEAVYMQETVTKFRNEETSAKTLTETVESLKKELEGVIEASWTSLISYLSHEEILEQIGEKVSEDEEEFLKSVAEDVAGTINDWSRNLSENRKNVLELLTSVWDADVDELVADAANCHLHKQKRKNCRLCSCKLVLSNYKKLFMARTTQCRPHNVECLMKIVLELSEAKNSAMRNCEKHIKLLEAMKSEYFGLKSALTDLMNLVTAKDKLISAKEPKDDSDVEDVGELQEKLIEKSESMISSLKKKHGTLLYLENLDKLSNGSDPGDRDPCPVCFSNLEAKWCVLECGHSYCIDCIKTLLKHGKDVTCPTCREVTPGSEIGYVDVTRKVQSQKSVRYSTKISAIVDTLLSLRESDPDVKVLIFSTWDVVLTVLKKALDENYISHRRLPGENPEKNLQDFKNPGLKVTALLFPISYGVTGLNLTEANHLFFIEPTVNMAEEQQAIGRIHRMGQTKETFVHRFFMSGTIEEKIHEAVKDTKYMPTYSTLEDVQKFYDTE